jgi:hypothetical protein
VVELNELIRVASALLISVVLAICVLIFSQALCAYVTGDFTAFLWLSRALAVAAFFASMITWQRFRRKLN